MPHPKLLIVEWVNALLSPLLGPLLAPLGVHTSPEHPNLIPDYIVMTMLVVAAVTVLAFIVRSRLSVDNPGKLQIVMEDAVTAMNGILNEWIPGKGSQYLPLIFSVFIFMFKGRTATFAGLVNRLALLLTAHRSTLTWSVALQLVDGELHARRLPVGAVGEQGIPDVDHRKDAGGQGNLLALQSTRVAASIPVLVVAVGDVERRAQIWDGQQ